MSIDRHKKIFIIKAKRENTGNRQEIDDQRQETTKEMCYEMRYVYVLEMGK